MTQDDLTKKLQAHSKWLKNEGGEQCVIIGENLSGLDLSNSDLTQIVLQDCNLTGANMANCVLRRANFSGSRGMQMVGTMIRR